MSVEDPRLSNISEENLTENFSSEIQEEIAASSTPSPIEHEIQVAQAGDSRTPTTNRIPTDPNAPAAAPTAPAAEVAPDANNVVHLATSVSIDDIRVDGANLILVQADGTEIVIVNGAAKIPTMLIGEVEVPQQVLFAALEDSGINVAAGPDGSFSASGRPDSSGADFEDSIQQSQNDPIQLASLLGDTEFGDGGGLDDRTAADDQPDAFDMGSPFIFSESVLADDVVGNETITGTLAFDGGDDFGIVSSVNYQSTSDMAEGTGSGVAAPLTSGGQPVTVSTSADGLTVTGTITVGETTVTVFTLTVTNPITGAFTYTQSQPLDHPDLGEIGADDALRLNFTFTVTDKDGDSDTGSFSIEIGDDGPSIGGAVTLVSVNEDDLSNGNDEGEVRESLVTSATLGISWGADANVKGESEGDTFGRSIAFVKSGLPQGLTSDGAEIFYGEPTVSSNGTVTIIAHKGNIEGPAVFTVTLDPTSEHGTATFELTGNLDHAGESDSLTLNFGYTATDADGDIAARTGIFSVNVDDDTPVSKGVVTASTVLDDEAQGNGNSGTSWLGDVSPNVASVSGLAGALFTAGADGVKSVAVQGPAFNVIYTDGDGFAHKEAIAWGPAGVVGLDGSTTFTATGAVSHQTAAVLVVHTDGSYTLTLEAPVAHDVALPAVEENKTLSFGFTVTDGDGDQASGTLNVRVNDDTPTPVASVVFASQAMDDEAQSLFTPVNTGGNGDVVVDTDTVSGGSGSLFKIGADGLGTLSVGLPGFSVVYEDGGFAKTESVSWDAGVRSANGTTTYTATGVVSQDTAAVLVIRADGSYSFTLEAPVVHSSTGTTEDNKILTFTYGVTDGDGDQAGGTLTVSVDDDTPKAYVVTSATVLDDEAQGSGNNTPADGIANEHVATGLAGSLFTAGADGVKSVAINGPAFSVVYEEGGFAKTESVDWSNGVPGPHGSTTFTATGHVSGQTAAVLVINADGSYNFTAEASIVHPTGGTTEENTTLSIGFTVTDGDGDQATGTLNINVNDDTPVSKGVVTASTVLDDEAQGNGNSGTSWLGDVSPNVASVSGLAGALFTAGADGVKSVAVQGPAFNVIYTDGDGFAHKEAIAWGPAGVVGLDGSTTFTATGAVSHQTAAVLVVHTDGSYTLTLEAPVAHDVALPAVEENKTLSFGFTVTDGDGDQASGTLNVRVNDDTPTPVASVVFASQAMDDEAQSLFTPVNTGGNGDVVVDTDTVSGGSGSLFKIGADGLGTLSVGLPGFSVVYEDGGFAKTESVSWDAGVRSANGTTTYTATGVVSQDTAAVLVIRADGSYSFTLEAPVVHSSTGTTEDNKILTFTYGVTDGDGDQAGGTLTVSVDDDTPKAYVVTSATVLDDEAQGSGNNTPADGIANEHVATGLAGSLFTAGADGVKSVAINGPAFSVVYEEGGFAKTESVDWSNGVPGPHGSTTFTATGHVSGQTAAVLVINADGSYNFTAEASIVHPTGGTTEENTTLSIGFTVTDGDGDQATGTLNINVNDDTPVSKGVVTASTVLDDEAQGNGNSGTSWLGDVSPNVASVSGLAGALFTAGADGVKSVAVQGPAFNVIYTDGDGFAHKEAIAWGPAGVVGLDGSTTFTATGAVSHQTAAVLVVHTDGSYTLTLEAPVAHDVALPAVEENKTLSFGFTVTDGDGDQASGTLNVRVNDDTPTPVASVVFASQAMDDEAQSLFTPVNTGGNGDVVVDTDTVSGGSGSLFKIGADGLGTLSVGLPGFSVVYEDGGFAKTESVSWDAGVRSANGTTTYTATGVVSQDTAAVLVIRADGSYSFTLEAPVVHSSTGTTEDNKILTFTYGVTDGDGDQAGGTLTVSVDDDTPKAYVVTSATVLDDEAQGSGNNTPADGIANEHVATGLAGSLFTAGADGVKSVAINGPAFSVVYEEGGFAKTESVDWSNGVPGPHGSTTFTATGHVSGQTAAVLVINADGSYNFTAEASIVHPTGGTTEENTTLSIGFTVTDGDGDQATGTLNINVNDDTPVSKGVVTASTVLDDEAQGNGNSGTSWLGDVSPNVASVSGLAGALFTAGADGVKSVAVQGPAFNVIYTDGDGFAHKEAIAWGPAGVVGLDGSTTFTATGAVSHQTAAVLVVHTDGSYTLTLEAPVAHDVALPAVEENKTLSFGFTVTDGDGDQASGTLNVRVNDDTPTPVASVVFASQAMDDEAQSLFTPVNTGGNGDVVVDTDTVSGGSGSLFKIGADGLGTLSVGLPGFSVVYEDGGFAKTESVSWDAGVRSANGTTTYTATGVVSQDTAAVLVIRADGSYSFTLEAPVVHSSTGTTEDNKILTFTYGVTDGDGDQAGGTLTVSVDDDTPKAYVVTSATVLDDEAQGSGNNTPADGIANEHVATGLAGSLFTAGADGVKSVAINGPAFSVVYEEGGFAKTESVDWSNGVPGPHGSTTFTATGHVSGQTAAVLVINADGSYNFTAEASIVHPTGGTTEENTTLSIGFTVTDGDGDQATGTLNINVNDDTPQIIDTNTLVQIDEDALAHGNPNGNGDDIDAAALTGILTHASGADGTASVLWSTAGVTLPSGFWFSVSTDGTVMTITQDKGGTYVPVVTLTITDTATGAYSVAQVAPINHPQGTIPGFEDNVQFTVSYDVTDGDGDSVRGTISVNVDDDTPTVEANAAIQLDDDMLAGGNPGGIGDDVETSVLTGTLANHGGADGTASVLWAPNGLTLPNGFWYDLSADSKTMTITQLQNGSYVNVFKVTITDTATGAYEVEPLNPVAHGVAGSEDNAEVSFQYRVTDGDGDVATGTLTVNIDDDTPVSTGVIGTGAITESAAGGSIEGELSALVSPGADGIGRYSVETTGLSSSLTSLTSGGVALTYSVVGNALIAKAGAATIFTFSVDPATGHYTFTQTGSLDHTDNVVIDGVSIPAAALDAAGNHAAVADIGGNDLAFVGHMPDGDAIIRVSNSGNSVVTWTLHNDAGGADYVLQIPAHTTWYVNVGNVANQTKFDLDGVGSPHGSTTVNNGHSITFTDGDGSLALDLSSAITVTDGDGDSVALHNQLIVTVTDSVPTAGPNAIGTVEEGGTETITAALTGLSWGADAGSARTLSFTGSVATTDQNGASVTALSSNGHPVTIDIINGVLTGFIGSANPPAPSDIVFTASLDVPTGAYSFSLAQPLDHTAPNEASQYLDLALGFTATDTDGDAATSTVTVRVDAAGSIDSINYSSLSTSVFVNLDGAAHLVDGQTVAADTATDGATVIDKVIGIDSVSGIVDALGGASNDVLIGGDEANKLTGNGGNDYLDGGLGADVLDGGEGNDTFVLGADVTGSGTRNIQLGDGSLLAVSIAGLAGTADKVVGGTGSDTIILERDGKPGFVADYSTAPGYLAGVEKIVGTDGNDVILLAAGSTADSGPITIEGGDGNDTLGGSNSADIINGGDGNDLISGLGGNDALSGGNGDDVIWGGDGADAIYGGADNDTLIGGKGDDLLDGGSNGAVVFNRPSNPASGDAAAIIASAVGGDTADYSSLTTGVLANLGGPASWPVAIPGHSAIDRDGANDAVGTDTLVDIENLTGGAGDDILAGDGNSNVLRGGAGSDTLLGGAGNDLLIGGDDSVADGLFAGAGDDVLILGNGGGTAKGEGGNDLIYGGSGGDWLYGEDDGNPDPADAGDDIIFAGAGNDHVEGGGGADQLYGEDGNDTLIGGKGDDIINGGDGDDTIQWSVGDGLDVIDGGAELAGGRDLLRVVGSSADEQYAIWSVAAYNAAHSGAEYIGSAEILLTVNGALAAEVNEIEEIVIQGGGGADTLAVNGSFAGTSLLTSTITYEGGEGDETFDVSELTSGHSVVVKGAGGADVLVIGDEGGETVWKDVIVTQDPVSGEFTILLPNGGPVLKATGVESFQFADGTVTAAQLIEQAPTDLTTSGLTVAENSAAGTVVGSVKGVDANGSIDPLSYAFVLADSSTSLTSADGRFVINASTGEITVAAGAVLDYETTPSIDLSVLVTDSKNGSYSETFSVQLENVNEAPTDITAPALSVAENSIDGTVVGSVTGVDADSSGLNYSFVVGGALSATSADGRFSINATTGEITVANGTLLDYETGSSHDVTVRVTDAGNLYREENFSITVTDVPENIDPVVTGSTNGSVTEDAVITVPGGELVNNGGFETGNFSGWSWSATSFTGVTQDSSEVHGGSWALETGPTSGLPTMSQTIQTVAGQTYTLSFWMRLDDNDNEFLLNVGGNTLAHFVDAAQFGYTAYNYQFTASATSTTLQFGFYNRPDYFYLDDISVKATGTVVPENQTASGLVSFTDGNVADAHTVSFAALAGGVGYVGQFNLGSVTEANGSGSVSWNFSVDNDDLQFLGGGQSIDQTYVVTIDDGEGGTTTQNVVVTLNGVNDAPVVAHVIADQGIAEEGTINFVVPADVFSDIDGDTLSYTATLSNGNALPAWLHFDAATRTFSGVAPLDYNGSIDVKVTASDASLTASDTFSLTVTPVNDAPTAVDDVLSSVAEDSGVRIISFDSLLGNDGKGAADETGQTLTITGLSNIVGGTAVISGTNILFTPAANFNGAASFDYTVSDNGQTNGANDFKTDVGSVSFTVTPVDDGPIVATFTNQSGSANMNSYDKVVFNNSSINPGDSALVTVSNFNTAAGGDKISITVGGTALTGGFTTASDSIFGDTDISSSVRIVQLTATTTNSNLNNDGNNDVIENMIVNATDDYSFTGSGKNYVFIVYSGTGSNVNAGIYTVNVSGTNGRDNVSVGNITVEHVMTIQGIAYGSLNASHFVAAADPIILDLDHNGFTFTSVEDGVKFDIDADGHKDQVAWTKTDGILAYDVDGNGKIDNGSEIFTPNFAGGAHAGGVAALSTLDVNHDGKIDASDTGFDKLLVWQDANGNGISDEGELKGLHDYGITGISLDADSAEGYIDGQALFAEGTFTYADGSTGSFVEVGFDTLFNDAPDHVLVGTDGDDILAAMPGLTQMTGGAGADTFVLDPSALHELDMADVITDYKSSEGDAVDVSKLLDTLLGHQATGEEAAANVRTTIAGNDTTVSVQVATDSWKDVAVLQNHTEAVKILFDDDKHAANISHV